MSTAVSPSPSIRTRLAHHKWPIGLRGGHRVLVLPLFRDPAEPGPAGLGAGHRMAARRHDQRVPDVGDHGAGAERGGRLRRAARPRLRRLLGPRRLHGRLADGLPVQLDVGLPPCPRSRRACPAPINFWLVCIIAGCFCAILGIIIGTPTLRLRGDYLALVTLGFGEVITQFFRNSNDIAGFNIANGDQDQSHRPDWHRPRSAPRDRPAPAHQLRGRQCRRSSSSVSWSGSASSSPCGSGKDGSAGRGWPSARTSWPPSMMGVPLVT